MNVTYLQETEDTEEKAAVFGKDGDDKIIEVPCGTVTYDGDTGEFLCEATETAKQYC